MPAYYDAIAKETIFIFEGQRLTIPDYMTIEDIAYFIEEKELKSAQSFMQRATYDSEQESPLEKARSHYKQLGWFKDNKDDD